MQLIPLLETINIPLAPFTRSPPSQILEILDVVNIIQPFRKRLSEKVHATIPKGIVGGFVRPVFQRNFKEWHESPRTYVRKGNRSSRPKSYRPEPESCCPKYIVMSPEINSHVARNGNQQK